MSKLQLWQPFIVISLALCIGTLGTALASPLYPIYQQVWHLLPSHITYIFVAYMLGCLATILFLGRTSNTIGFLSTLKIGLGFVIAGLILSAIAFNAYWLGVGRFIIGIASGLITTSALLGLLTVIPDSHKASASSLSSIVTVIGFSMGPFVGGLIAEFSDYPLVTPYVPIVIIAIFCLIGLFTLSTPHFEKQSFSIAPHLELPVAGYKAQFLIVGLTAFSIFAIFSLFASLASSFVKEVLPWHGPFISGVTIASILFVSAFVQFVIKAWSPYKNLMMGLSFTIISLLLLAICMYCGWSWLFFVSDILVGIGHGAGLLGAFALVHEMTTVKNRAAVVSTYLFMGYLGTIIPIVAVGYFADHFGLVIAVIGFSLTMSALVAVLWIWQKQLILSKKQLSH